MIENTVVQVIPLERDAHGVVRIGGTRVTLDSLVHSFRQGASAEEIVQQYPTLRLGDVYAVIGYYLQNRDEIDAAIQQTEEHADEFKRAHERYFVHDLREKLLARRNQRAN